MHDEVDVVDEHPPPTLHPLDVFRSHVLLLELVDDVSGDRLDLHVRLTRRQEKAIGSSGEGPEIQGNDICRLAFEGEPARTVNDLRQWEHLLVRLRSHY